MTQPLINRRHLVAAAAAGLLPTALQAQSAYPNRPIEVLVPAAAGGGTDVLTRNFAESVKKHLPQPLVVTNRPGASGAIGMGEMINAKPDGYKLCMVIVEITILQHLGLTKLTQEDFIPIARLNADPAAITVKAEAPWNTIEEFLAAARKSPGELKMGNSGPGSIWHLAHAALEDKAGVRFNAIPFQGAAPAVVGLLGGHIDAVAVSPGEVSTHVNGGKLKMLAVMADQRLKGFPNVPTLKERNIDVSIAAWRGLAAPKGTPPEVVAALKTAARKVADDPAFKEALDKVNLGFAYADGDAFHTAMQKDSDAFKALIGKLGLKV